MKKNILFLLIGIVTSISLFAQIPVGYYDTADGKSAAALKTSMHQIIQNFIDLDFTGFSAAYWGENYFRRSDWHANGYFWDMYSTNQRVVYNSGMMDREHCMPRSWWGTSEYYGRANSDLNNLYPADGVANGRKSNYPLGETANHAWTNTVVKVGRNSFSTDYTGYVFEPADEYKGDFARTYLYMVTSYEDYAARWQDNGITSMLNNETYPVFKPWAIDLLLKWHRNDPVSQKERNRNDSVFVLQQNRNPFIDIPDLVEYIWGNKKDQPISINNKASNPTLIIPSDGVSVNFGVVRPAFPYRTFDIPVRGILLNSALTVDFLENTSGFFRVAENTVASAQANAASGCFLSISYSPTSNGTHTAKLRISSPELSKPTIVLLQGSREPAPSPVRPVQPTDDMEVVIFYTGTSTTNAWAVANLPANFTTNAGSEPYANGDFSFRSNNENLIVEYNEEADFLQFSIYPRNAWNDNENHLYVYEGQGANDFNPEPIADFNNDFVTNGTGYNNTPEIPLNRNSRAIKIEYIKQAQNVGINNVIIARKKQILRTIDKTICQGETYNFYGTIYNSTQTGITKSITNGTGCDSIITLNLTVNPILTRTIDKTIYQGETYNFYGTIYNSTQTGITKSITNGTGCDSIITLNLTVNPILTTNANINHNAVMLFYENNLLHIQHANIGESIYIYDILGNIIKKQTITDQQQTVIPVERKGIFLVKINSTIHKFVAK